MEYKSIVFNAARDGKITRLRIYLDHRPKDEVKSLVHAKTNGATPLIMSCRNGHLEVVEYLIKHCGADLEQVGSVTFDGETIDGAPPLWCAAAAGHMDVVKLLVKNRACVNNTTTTNSTPLRAACFDGHFDIVKYLVDQKADVEIANRHGHTCLMISCYKGHFNIVKFLLNLKANVNRKSVKGNTALHDCAESGCLDIMQLLLEHKALMDKDAYGMTPLLAASVTGHTKIVEYLIQRSDIDRREKIDALELLGATYVDKKRDMLGALQYWRRALKERYCVKKGVIEKAKNISPVEAYENALEVSTLEELDELISDPDDMRMQALLVRERILGPAHPDTSYYIRYRGAVYADMGNFERCVTLWMYALDMQQKILEPLNAMAQSSLLSFAELFAFMMTSHRHRPAQVIPFNDVYRVMERAVHELDRGMKMIKETPINERDFTHFNRTLIIVVHLISLACRIQTQLSEDEAHQFKKLMYSLVKLNPRNSKGQTLLHLAVDKETSNVGRYPVCAFPSLDVTKLLLEVGASVKATDLDGNTPLLTSAMNDPLHAEVLRTLLEAGSHIDLCNIDGKNTLSVLGKEIYGVACPLNYRSLQCLASATIIKYKINYEGHVAKRLECFVSKH